VIEFAKQRPWLVVVVGVIALAGVTVAFAALGWDANALAAAASAVAALAALGTATESTRTAREATRALSFATKPDIATHIMQWSDELPCVAIVNVGTAAIGRASVEWRLRDGTTGKRELGPLRGTRDLSAKWTNQPRYEPVGLGPKLGELGGTDQLIVEYWGAYGGIGWRRVVEWNHTVNRTETTLSYGHEQRQVSEVEIG